MANQSNINPGFKRNPSPQYSIEYCITNIQDYKILSHLISKAESKLDTDQNFVSEVLNILPNKQSKRIAISGSPGVGKSTFINSIGKLLVDQGARIAVLPVDPSSHVSRGSILGDKTRMEDLIKLDKVFIKPMASSLALGGVAPASQMATLLCEKAGFDYILIETVGVGQSEYEVRHLVDLFILLLQPGGGDDLQGIKRGIMEMADLMVVTKADGALKSNAKQSFEAYKNASKLLLPNSLDWRPKVKLYSSITKEGSETLFNCLDQYFEFLEKEDRITQLRDAQNEYFFNKEYKSILLSHFENKRDFQDELKLIKEAFKNKNILIFEAIQKLKSLIAHEA